MTAEPAPGIDGIPRIRFTTEGDIARIQRIYTHHVEHGAASFELEPPSAEEMTRRFRAVLEAGYPHLVAELGGDVLGYAYASAYRPRPAYRTTVEDSIYVEAGAEGRGIGRALLARLIDECERRGFRQMMAVIGDNVPASIALHRSFGFREIGVLKAVGFKHGRWCDSTLMQRALGPGDTRPPG